MQLKDVMNRDVEVVHPNAALEEAAAKMDALDVGPLPVCDGDRLVGMASGASANSSQRSGSASQTSRST